MINIGISPLLVALVVIVVLIIIAWALFRPSI